MKKKKTEMTPNGQCMALVPQKPMPRRGDAHGIHGSLDPWQKKGPNGSKLLRCPTRKDSPSVSPAAQSPPCFLEMGFAIIDTSISNRHGIFCCF